MNLPTLTGALRRLPRTTSWAIAAAVLLAAVAVLSPVQLPVVLYKTAMIPLGVVLAYWIDRALFPYARPDGYLVRQWRGSQEAPDGQVDHPVVSGYHQVFCFAMIRRAIIVGVVVIGITQGM